MKRLREVNPRFCRYGCYDRPESLSSDVLLCPNLHVRIYMYLEFKNTLNICHTNILGNI